MEIEFLNALAKYGPLGLWTASLLWMNYQIRKEQREVEKDTKNLLRYHQENIVSRLTEQEHLLEKAIEKIDSGLAAMKEKYAEDRILRMKGSD